MNKYFKLVLVNGALIALFLIPVLPLALNGYFLAAKTCVRLSQLSIVIMFGSISLFQYEEG